jgi:uncharacterized protein YegP (UPF0339 family)
MAAKFTIFYDKAKKFRFNLKATNGQIIASSEAYETKVAALNGIKSIKKNAPAADIQDETVEKTPAPKKIAVRKPAVPKSATPKKPGRKPAKKKV